MAQRSSRTMPPQFAMVKIDGYQRVVYELLEMLRAGGVDFPAPPPDAYTAALTVRSPSSGEWAATCNYAYIQPTVVPVEVPPGKLLTAYAWLWGELATILDPTTYNALLVEYRARNAKWARDYRLQLKGGNRGKD